MFKISAFLNHVMYWYTCTQRIALLFSIIYLALFIYVIFLTIWNSKKIKKIEKNIDGKFGGGLEQDLLQQNRKVKDLLLGFTPVEALKYLADMAIATVAIIGLFYSSN